MPTLEEQLNTKQLKLQQKKWSKGCMAKICQAWDKHCIINQHPPKLESLELCGEINVSGHSSVLAPFFERCGASVKALTVTGQRGYLNPPLCRDIHTYIPGLKHLSVGEKKGEQRPLIDCRDPQELKAIMKEGKLESLEFRFHARTVGIS